MLVTLDTNILYQALMSNAGASYFILQLVRNRKIQIALSVPVFSEYQDVLTRKNSLDDFELEIVDIDKILRFIAYGGKTMPKSSVLTIRIPADLKHKISQIAEEQGVSINQLAMYIFAKEVGSLEASQNISKNWKGYSKEDLLTGFDEVMLKVKRKPVPDWDKLD